MKFISHWWFVCLISLKGIATAKIYVIDVPVHDDIHPRYDNYDVSYDEYSKEHRHTTDELGKEIDELGKEIEQSIVMCQRIFGSMYGNKNQHVLCLKALNHEREKNLDLKKEKFRILNPSIHHQHDQVGRQQYNKFLDLTRFSQDYLDVNDLARSDFAMDYLDINDLRSNRDVVPQCKEEFDEFGKITKDCDGRISRKSLDKGNFKFKVKESSESESESYEKSSILRKKNKKNKRYKVVSSEVNNHWDSSDKSDDISDEKVGSGSSIQNSDSIEVTTKKSKKKHKKSKKGTDDGYMYLQGNKIYDKDELRRNNIYFRNGPGNALVGNRNIPQPRRGLRMSHFLPKRYHYNEDEYQNLGYYWFNGPRGKYKQWQTR